eukprot:Tbor_TRINITY_DN4214_c0_g3::TRINITY_DN4214_c0_g3_i1::g.23890::m.23890/K12844/PRPF31; U4/U6 small nuclear ribonucleoprotein PRP31
MFGFDDTDDDIFTRNHRTTGTKRGRDTSRNSTEAHDVDKLGKSSSTFTADMDMLCYSKVTEVTHLIGSSIIMDTILQLKAYQENDEKKGTLTKSDKEYDFLLKCCNLVWEIEGEKSKAHKFAVDHYSLRFPELTQMIPDNAITYANCVKAIGNNMDLSDTVGILEDLLPSQIIAVIIACASTTSGKTMSHERMEAVFTACDTICLLEEVKQLLLEYIQTRMPLVAPNLCAFLGAGLTSQIFAFCISLTKVAQLDPSEIIALGSKRANSSGINVHTSGFLSNSDLVLNHPPEMRSKALRLVALNVVNLARIDDNRPGSDDSAGLKARDDVRVKMVRWTDPLLQKGAANNTYERLSKAQQARRNAAKKVEGARKWWA